jgi:hypothetical protein
MNNNSGIDPMKHFKFSMIKSMFRLGAGISLVFYLFVLAGLLFIIAEIFGIIEEMV